MLSAMLYRNIIVGFPCDRFEDDTVARGQHWGMKTRTAAVNDENIVEWNEQFVLRLSEISETNMQRLKVVLWETSIDAHGHHIGFAVFPVKPLVFTETEGAFPITFDLMSQSGAACGKLYLQMKSELTKEASMINNKKCSTSGLAFHLSCAL